MLEHGASPYQVFQRDSAATAAIPLQGRVQSGGSRIQARLLHAADGAPLSGFPWAAVATAGSDGQWTGALERVPVGGPYSLELRAVDPNGTDRSTATVVQPLFVGDLWVAAGQSNMIGRGRLGPDREAPDPQVTVFDCDYRWRPSSEPVNGPNTDPISAHPNYRSDRGSHSCCLRFAKDLFAATEVPVGILPCAIGGSPMAHWRRPQQHDDDTQLYGRTLKRIARAGGRVAGFIWWQGESDTTSGLEAFKADFQSIIRNFRQDLTTPELPFLFVQLENTDAAHIGAAQWNAVREAQRQTERDTAAAAMVTAADLPRLDEFHVDTPGLKIVGVRLALAARALVHGHNVAWTGPRFREAAFADRTCRAIRVLFAGVPDRIEPETAIRDFTVRSGKGEIPVQSTFRDPNCAFAAIVELVSPAAPGATISYGAGCNPDLNLTDASGLPAPIWIDQPIAVP